MILLIAFVFGYCIGHDLKKKQTQVKKKAKIVYDNIFN